MESDEQAKAREAAERQATKITCDVLCSLSNATTLEPCRPGMTAGTAAANHQQHPSECPFASMAHAAPPQGDMQFSGPWDCSSNNDSPSNIVDNSQRNAKPCPKQHQLPMFLSKTYHMIDRCNADIATWADSGDSFVVKNVDKFSGEVLPLYFKHSNFSSFARQLNFYGFRKLRSDPILTSDVDPQTASYIRFYHSKFQRDRPDLLHQIKRATKSEQQSKDDVDGLKGEVCRLKDCVQQISADMERKLAEMSYEYNRRIANLSAEYDKLANLVTQLLHHHQHQHQVNGGAPPPPLILQPAPHAHHSVARASVPSFVTTTTSASTAPASSFVSLAASSAPMHHSIMLGPPTAPAPAPEKMSSLSHAVAMRLEQKAQQHAKQEPQPLPSSAQSTENAEAARVGEKRPAPEGDKEEGPPPSSTVKAKPRK